MDEKDPLVAAEKQLIEMQKLIKGLAYPLYAQFRYGRVRKSDQFSTDQSASTTKYNNTCKSQKKVLGNHYEQSLWDVGGWLYHPSFINSFGLHLIYISKFFLYQWKKAAKASFLLYMSLPTLALSPHPKNDRFPVTPHKKDCLLLHLHLRPHPTLQSRWKK